MKTRKFNHGNLEVSAIGFGCMGLSHGYGAVPEREESIRLIVPIPGIKREERLIENLSAANVELTYSEFDTIENELAKLQIYGNRTDEDIAFGM